MFYAAIRKYSINPTFVDEVIQRIQREFLPIISQEPGNLAYYALRVGDNQVLTISVFETQAGAEGSTPLAFEWVQNRIAGFVQGIPEATVGQVFAISFGGYNREPPNSDAELIF